MICHLVYRTVVYYFLFNLEYSVMKAIKLVDICQALIEETITKQGCRQSHDLIFGQNHLSLDQLLTQWKNKNNKKLRELRCFGVTCLCLFNNIFY